MTLSRRLLPLSVARPKPTVSGRRTLSPSDWQRDPLQMLETALADVEVSRRMPVIPSLLPLPIDSSLPDWQLSS